MKYTSAQLSETPTGFKGRINYKDENGKWCAKYRMLKSTGKREAKRELEAWRDEMEEKARRETPGIKRPDNVGAFVAQYIDTLESSQSVERSTLTPYRAMQRHIDSGLGSIAVEDLDADAVQAWINSMAANGYAASTIRKALNLLKAAYKDAVQRRVIKYSPVDVVKAPKLKKAEPNSLGSDQRAKLIAYLDIAGKTPVNLAIRMALHTGMREQELCGLRWKDVDLQTGVIHIRNVIGRDGGKTYEKEPKTGGSRRDIPIPQELVNALKDRRTEMMEECMEAGIAMTPDLHVIGRIDGSYMSPHSLWREWKAISKSLGLVGMEGKPPAFHDLRHTFATAAIKSGADVKSVSSILGHANAAMTLNIYANADAEAKRRAMERATEEIASGPIPEDMLELGSTSIDNGQ